MIGVETRNTQITAFMANPNHAGLLQDFGPLSGADLICTCFTPPLQTTD